MATLTIQPTGRRQIVANGTTLLEALHRAGHYVPSVCGGDGTCGTCAVALIDTTSAATDRDRELIPKSELADGVRLACRIRLDRDLTVRLGEESTLRQAIITDFAGREAVSDGELKRHRIQVDEATLEDQRPDDRRVAAAVGRIGTSSHDATGGDDAQVIPGAGAPFDPIMPIELVRRIPGLLREHGRELTAILDRQRLVDIGPRTEVAPVGLAVDLGSTTIVCAIVDLESARVIAVGSTANGQSVRGDDVVHRIAFAAETVANRDELAGLAVKAIVSAATDACHRAGRRLEEVSRVVVAGNSTMVHLLLRLDPHGLAQSPYVAATNGGFEVDAIEVGLPVAPGARLWTMPAISAWVGGDIVAGALAHDLEASGPTTLHLDLGTNGEIMLSHDNVLYACSTAAGPAFEGAGISCGMRATAGAISAAECLDGELVIATIDNQPAVGICGSGLVDVVAEMRAAGVIDVTGRILTGERLDGVMPAVAGRVIDRDGQPAIRLDETGLLALTQKDIRQLQLAKGAIAAGTTVLCGLAGVAPGDVDRVLLAGGFGTYLRTSSAQRIGLLPRELDAGVVTPVGDAALAGARIGLVNRLERHAAQQVADQVRYVELSGRIDFQEAFVDAMEM